MNFADERSRSCWLDNSSEVDGPPLEGEHECDVLLVGAGIADLSTAANSLVTLMHGYIRTGTNPQLCSDALSRGPAFEHHLEHVKTSRAAL